MLSNSLKAQAGLLAVLTGTTLGVHQSNSSVRADIVADMGECLMTSGTQGAPQPPTWPSVEEQLATSKVVHGSALEKLIRGNQDFTMLRPEEAHDKVRLPPWIRIHWRKLHPDGKYFGPSGGYPLVLKQLYDWMLAHQDLPGYDPTGGGSGQQPGGRDGH
jgi:hypothetical protein